jgi:DNA-binding GntR family transcriptional regulator
MDNVQYFSLSDQVYTILKRSIVERRLGPNTKLDINGMGQQMGVSRMPILDALTRLEAEGLVTRKNRVGTYVTPIDRHMFEEMFETRDMIEQWTTDKVVANLTEADLDELGKLLDKAGKLLAGVDEQDFDYRQYIEYDERFHVKLIRVSRNTRVIGFYLSLNSHMQIARAYSLRALTRSQEGQHEHEAILEAFAARDVKRARKAQQHHLQRSRSGVLALLEEHGGVF